MSIIIILGAVFVVCNGNDVAKPRDIIIGAVFAVRSISILTLLLLMRLSLQSFNKSIFGNDMDEKYS